MKYALFGRNYPIKPRSSNRTPWLNIRQGGKKTKRKHYDEDWRPSLWRNLIYEKWIYIIFGFFLALFVRWPLPLAYFKFLHPDLLIQDWSLWLSIGILFLWPEYLHSAFCSAKLNSSAHLFKFPMMCNLGITYNLRPSPLTNAAPLPRSCNDNSGYALIFLDWVWDSQWFWLFHISKNRQKNLIFYFAET